MKKFTVLLFFIFLFVLSACTSDTTSSTSTGVVAVAQPWDTAVSTSENTAVSTAATPQVTLQPVEVEYDSDDLAETINESATTTITLAGDSIAVEGTGASVNGSTVTITAAGSYRISGVLRDGQILVDTQDEDAVILVLDGIDITNSTSAPIFVSNADKTVIDLAAGTENVVTDGSSYVFAEATDEPNAAIFSKDDLTITGSGSLTVNANYNNGIASKDDLKITGGTITVNATNDGIKGRDSLAILDGTITIRAGADGMQANNDTDAEKGFVVIEGGTLNITAVSDGIQAETQLLISGGSINITAGGGNGYSVVDSAKGLKSGINLTISGGTITIDAADDALHANTNLTINGGDITLATGDDGVHADANITINNGNLSIVKSYEGIESGVIIINGGNIHLRSSDDGINVSSGQGEGGMGFPGQGASGSSSYYLEINGGYLFVDADGDGLDSNGLGTMNDGVVIVNGPVMSGNGTLDVNGMLTINGGFLIGAGSAGMAQSPSTASTQYSVLQMIPNNQAGGSMVHIESSDGEEIATFVPTKSYQSIVVSSPALENGKTYVVYVGGSSTGTAVDGLYSDGTYSPGTQVASFTISSIVTGASGGMGGMGGGGRGGHGGRP
ncbi:MAG: carbohydrate-binding domain-containing protein [Chloroflexota bacterium]